jgi:hypothetical protein
MANISCIRLIMALWYQSIHYLFFLFFLGKSNDVMDKLEDDGVGQDDVKKYY